MPVVHCPDCGRDVSTLAPACPHCGRPSPGLSAPGVAAAAAAAPPVQEQTIWSGTPSPITLIGHVLGMVAVLVLIPLFAGFMAKSMDPYQAERFRHAAWIITLIIVAVQLISFFIALMRVRSTTYTVTNQRIMIEQGILSKSVGEIDLRYVDETEFFQRFTERLLGIGSVTLISSDKAFPTTVLRSIKDPRGVRELIRTHAYQASQRQLFTRAT